MARTLDQWVDYIQTLHFREIELSLERVRSVFMRMYPNGLPYKVITLSGTNGKGSTAEIIASIYREAGYQVGKFTSPHLVHFNERFNLNSASVDDTSLLAAFDRVEASRQDTPITFFEYGTLLAIDLFANSGVEVAVMEVGLGGRLDSVNILDADVSIVTSISIDHTSWLGNTIEEIAYEKVGIARHDKPLVLGLSKPPKNMLEYAFELGSSVSVIGQDFRYHYTGCDDWDWSDQAGNALTGLPLPYGQAGVQLSNCSLALHAVQLMSEQLAVSTSQIYQGIEKANILGRCQIVRRDPTIILDVSHNENSVSRLASFIQTVTKPSGRTIAVCGMLKDKQIKASLQQIKLSVDQWYVATIHNERGASANDLATSVSELGARDVEQYDHVQDAYNAALVTLTTDDCLVVFGSFHIVGDILAHRN